MEAICIILDVNKGHSMRKKIKLLLPMYLLEVFYAFTNVKIMNQAKTLAL